MRKKEPILCSDECFHYTTWAGDEGCGKKGGMYNVFPPESVRPGQKCLYPKDKEIPKTYFTMSIGGFCAALSGTVIEGGPADNTKLVNILTNTPEDNSK